MRRLNRRACVVVGLAVLSSAAVAGSSGGDAEAEASALRTAKALFQ